MGKLPNADKAIVPLEKFTEYALNPEHPTGRHKARVFKAGLGLTLDDAEFLRQKVKSVAENFEAIVAEPTSYGERYVIDFELTTDKGTAKIRSAWMVRKGEDIPRLTSCYVIEE